MKPRKVTLHSDKGKDLYPSGTRIHYGQRFSGAIFDHVAIVDLPSEPSDFEWMAVHLMPRLAPSATIQMPGAAVGRRPDLAGPLEGQSEIFDVIGDES
ncbi:hypothetical protein [Glutamicibacter sp. FBE19]|uniref:hypothetical protein n=1 Tax=Glutamicibacter sp. FBE19 TaxID=2761534 RepID=UPI0018968171|nr:hypothetical protein [Glutamicibacter sp. FBE19]MBF6671549.1 hypothetical protein [Glutamicibacter sp. FBE19]